MGGVRLFLDMGSFPLGNRNGMGVGCVMILRCLMNWVDCGGGLFWVGGWVGGWMDGWRRHLRLINLCSSSCMSR